MSKANLFITKCMSQRDIYCIGNNMNRYEAMEYLMVNRDLITGSERWHFLDECGCFNEDHDVLSFAFWFSESSNLLGEDYIKFNGILDHLKEENFVTSKQINWLLLAISDHWDCLTSKARAKMQCLI